MGKARATEAQAGLGHAAVAPDVPALEVEHVSKAFGQRRAVDDLTFAVPQGAFLSVFGPNGAGKSTLLRMVATLSRPSSGTIRLLGTDVVEDAERARASIGLISHASMLYGDLTAYENLMLAARLYGVADPDARVRDLLEQVELSHRAMDVVRTFSRGMTQRVSIARALVNDPAVVLLDEPYSGLDPHASEVFDQLISRARKGRTFVMVSHDLDKGLSLSTHVLVMARGRRAAFAPTAKVDPGAFASFFHDVVGQGVA